MAEERLKRRLAAILSADVVGYARLMGADEAGTLARLNTLRREILDPTISAHSGRVVKLMGDGVLAEFASVVEAVNCAIEIQQQVTTRDNRGSEAGPLRYRIGVHIGDVIIEGGDIFGDGINIAARLETIAEPGGISISDDAWRQVHGKVQANFIDTGEQSLKNIARPIRVYRVTTEAGNTQQLTDAPSVVWLRDTLSMAVLPFRNVSGDPDQEYFCDGVTEEIITALSRWRSFLVISRNSSFTYRGQNADVRQIGRELGARYVVEGSVRKAGDRVRITAQVSESTTGLQIWSERFDEFLSDIFRLQDEISQKIAGAVGPTLALNEGRRAAQKRIEDLSAWDLYLRGRWHYYQNSLESRLKALTCFERSTELAPEFSDGHACIAPALIGNVVYGFSDDRERDLKRAIEEARLAIQLDSNNANAWRALAHALSMVDDADAALEAARKAVSLNPHMSEAQFALGLASLYCGQLSDALAAIDAALRLNPTDTQNFARLATRASALYLLGRYNDAVSTALQSIRLSPKEFSGFRLPLRVLAASYGQLGMDPEAKSAVSELLAGDRTERTIADVVRPFRRASDREHYTEGLRKAGLPES